MGDFTDGLVFALVVLARFLVPLLIFRYPLPAIIAALLIDAADETVFDVLTNMELTFYQSYDKALDVYYLAIAYIATLRNWSNIFAYRVGKFLWYYRLAGSTLFELTGYRFLLMVFPNTFEYFFISYESVRTRWNPQRLAAGAVLLAAAGIWIFIKLPQEYWIHVAKLDATDFIKETILGTPLDESWGTALSDNLWVFPVLLAAGVGLFLLLRWLDQRLPPPDWKLTFDSNINADPLLFAHVRPKSERHWREGLIEKIVLVSLIVVIFAQMLPNVDVSTIQLVAGVIVVIVANAFISHALATRGTRWRSILTEFAGLAAINIAVTIVYVIILPSFDGSVRFRDLIFFNLLLTLIVTLYDRYRPIHDLRVAAREDETLATAHRKRDHAADSSID